MFQSFSGGYLPHRRSHPGLGPGGSWFGGYFALGSRFWGNRLALHYDLFQGRRVLAEEDHRSRWDKFEEGTIVIFWLWAILLLQGRGTGS